MANEIETISYINLGDGYNHPIDAVTVGGITLTSEEKEIWNEKQDALTFDSEPTENSENLVKSGSLYAVITDNELVTAAALNDLNDRMLDVEESMNSVLVSETDPVFSASPAASITASNISSWNAKQDALTFDSIPTENSDNLVKSGPLYTVLTNTELVVATALNDLNERLINVNSSISEVYDEIDRALTAVLTYKGTVGSNGDVSVLPSSHNVGDVYVVSVAGTYAGQTCEVGDYIICKTSRTSASNGDWNVVNGENQVSNSAASLAAPGSSVTIATVDGTNITISTPASWTGVSKNGTLTGVTFNGVSASVSNGVASVSVPINIEIVDIFSNGISTSVPSGTFNRINQAFKDGKSVVLRRSDGDYVFDYQCVVATEDDNYIFFNESDNLMVNINSDDSCTADNNYFLRSTALTFDSIPTENSDNLVKSGDLYDVIVSNERVVATALNDVNDRLLAVENVSTTHISGITFNGSSASISNGIASISVTIPTAVTEATVSGWGFTKNTGTLTGVTLNGVSASVSNGVASLSLTFDSIPTQNSDNLVKSGVLYSVITDNELVVSTALNDLNDRVSDLENNTGSGGITGVMFNGVSASISNGVASINASIPAEVTEATVSGWGFTKNTGTLTTHASHKLTATNGTATSVNQGTEITFIESLSGTTTATSGDLTVTATRKKVTIPTAVTEATVSGWGFTKNAGTLTSESDPVFVASPAHGITAADISNWNSKTSNTGTLTGVKFNGTNATVSNGVASISVTIPSAITESTVAGWGFTKNTGTLTSESDPVFSASVAASISAADISNWNSKTSNTGTITGISMNGSSKGTSGNVNLGTVVTGLSMNGSSVSISNGVANLGTVLTSHQSIKTINGQTITGTGDVTISGLPAATSSDNGKILQVVDGSWALVTPVNIYSGNGSPDNGQGTNGDLYIQTS